MPVSLYDQVKEQEVLDQLVEMVNETCLVALDKSLEIIRDHQTYLKAHERLKYISSKANAIVFETSMTLPLNQRTIKG